MKVIGKLLSVLLFATAIAAGIKLLCDWIGLKSEGYVDCSDDEMEHGQY